MATLACTGPAYIYIRMAGTTYFLGTAERAPLIDIIPAFSPVINDIGGDDLPIDLLYTGEMAKVTAEVNYFNEAAYNIISARPYHDPGFVPRGSNNRYGVGTLMLTEQFAFQLIIEFPFAGLAVGLAQGMPAGYRFLNAVLEGPDRITPGTRVRKTLMQFTCVRAYQTSGTYPFGFVLYDHTLGTLPGPI